VLRTHPTPPRSLQPGLDSTLEIIILKCLEKDPVKRYSSAVALAGDLGCWRRGDPITGRAPALWRRSWRSIRRHPASAAAISLLAVLVCVLGALGFSGVFGPDGTTARPPSQGFEPLLDLAAKGHWVAGNGTATSLEDGSIQLESSELALWEIPFDH